MAIAASEALFDRLAALAPEFPPPQWRELLAADAFAEPAALARLLSPAKTRADAALLLAAQLATQVADSEELDPHYLLALRPFWFTVATASLQDWQFWHSPRQPLRRLLHQLMVVGRNYSLSSHPASSQFPPRLQARLGHLAEQAIAGAGPSNLLPLLKSLYALLRHVHDQQRHSDHRLQEQEEQSRRTLYAETDSSRAIRREVWGQPVPATVVNFLDITWRKYLHLLHLKVGMQHPAWQQAIADIQLMVWLGSEASPAQLAEAVKGELPALMRRIRAALVQTRTDQDGQRFPEAFAGLLAARARNLPDAGLPLGELSDEPDDATGMTDAAGGHPDLPGHGESLLLRQNESWLRARVANYPAEQGYVLLADFAGSRITVLTAGELQKLVSEEKVRPIADHDPVMFLLPRLPVLLRGLLEQAANDQARLRQNALREQQAAEAHAMRAREAERIAELSRRQQAEAAAAAARQADEQRAAEKAALLANKALLLAEQTSNAEAIIASLRSGALVELKRDEEHFRACYLAMIRASDHCYVFVDRQGHKLAEHPVATLVELLLTDQLRIVESGSALDTTLQNLVSERRHFLSEEDPT